METDSDWFIMHSPRLWPARLACSREDAVRIAVAAVDWIPPEWRERRPSDSAPLRAVDAARENPSAGTTNLRLHLIALAEGCTAARRRSLGYEHRIAEAARAVAIAAAATDESVARTAVADALGKVEEHVLYRFAVAGVYGREPEVRRALIGIIGAVLQTPT